MRNQGLRILLLLLQFGVVGYVKAQKEVPILVTKSAYIVKFTSPTLQINIEDDPTVYYSFVNIVDSTLIFKSKAERRTFDNQREKRERELVRLDERRRKALAKGQKAPEEKPIPPVDYSPFLQNRDLLRAGLQVEVSFLEFRYSRKFVMQTITILTDLTGHGTISGTYEQLDGDVATVDGQAVRLKAGVSLVGEKGYKGRKFASFQEMEKGMEMRVKGQRQNDGVLLIESGMVEPDEFTDVDRKLLLTLQSTKKLSDDKNEVSFGNAKFKLLRDESINAYVTRVGRKLIPDHIKNLPKDHPAYINFNFFVVVDTTFNACAYPDGSVYIHTQLLNEMENEAQLAAVLGHEIAHVTYRHGRREFQRGQTINFAKDAVSTALVSAYGLESAQLATMVTAFGGGALSSKYSRDLENQADRIGLNYIYEAGYDPREAPRLWDRLHKKTPDVPGASFGAGILSKMNSLASAYNSGSTALQTKALIDAVGSSAFVETIYASHPAAGTRYKNLNFLIIKNYQDSDLDKLGKGDTEYKAIKKRLQRVIKGQPDDDDDDAVRAGTALKPSKTTAPPARKLKPAGSGKSSGAKKKSS